ncbi:MAG TPA: CARDB domain-containing protein [Polyangiaceae bacterium]|nr:CARDB domain-containing protein [Polyangiaceae bacterium]
MKRTAGFAMALGLLSTIALPAPEAEAQIQVVPMTQLTTVYVGCANPGSSQDVAKTPSLKNTTTSAIPKGSVLRWSANDGDKGTVTLAADLAPGATVKAQGIKPGNVYTCNANFQPKPDLIVKKVSWVNNNSAVAVEIGNLDAFIGAGQSAVKFEMVSCQGAVLKTATLQAASLPKSGVTSINVAATLPQTKFYFRVRADVAGQVSERNETNNLWDGIHSVCY